MTYEEDYGLDSFSRKWMLVLLDIDDAKGNKKTDILRINKIFKYFEYLLDQKNLDFSNYKLGAVSNELKETVEEFEENDLVVNDKGKFELTNDGEQAKEEVLEKLDKQEVKKLEFSKNLLNDLSDDELLFFMYMVFPETKEYSTQIERLLKKKKQLVESLYHKEKITAATAAKWLGISEESFSEDKKIQLSA